jgi:leucyl-tRNA synthetase
MPSIVDQVNPPLEGKENTNRKTVIAVVCNPIDGTYLCLKWSEQDWTTFITGGVEEGEDVVDSAKREVLEETGYSDIEFVRTLGGPTEAFFYAAHKGVNRQTQAQIILFNLKSNKRIEVADDERARHEAVWLNEEEVMSAKLRHSEFSLIMDRIKTGIDAYVGDGIIINSGAWNGLPVAEAKRRAVEDLRAKGIGEKKTTYHLRDWLISRQRYWGPPIPMIYCESCAENGKSWFQTKEALSQKILFRDQAEQAEMNMGWYPAEDLPIVLPRIDDYKPIGDDVKMVDGKAVTSPLGNHPEFYKTTCPHCGLEARRETDVSDTFLDSAWYFYRYFSAGDSEHAWSLPRDERWMPVSIYTGGAEHSVLHLLYSRFVTKAFKDAGLISNYDEPFPRFFAHGLIIKDGAKMSKSKGNVIVPDAYIKKFGADTLRTYLMFLGPFDGGGARVQRLIGTHPAILAGEQLTGQSYLVEVGWACPDVGRGARVRVTAAPNDPDLVG